MTLDTGSAKSLLFAIVGFIMPAAFGTWNTSSELPKSVKSTRGDTPIKGDVLYILVTRHLILLVLSALVLSLAIDEAKLPTQLQTDHPLSKVIIFCPAHFPFSLFPPSLEGNTGKENQD